jgi:hypothetical protein
MAIRYGYPHTSVALRDDATGLPLASATVTVYLAGTLTLAIAYADETTGVALTGSQTTTDSTGNFIFWVDPEDYSNTQQFKVIVTKAGYTDKVYDDIQIMLDLSGINDPWVDVRAYRAIGDGVTDDTTAIQAAIDSLPAAGGIVFFPTGDYLISSGLTISGTGIHFKGVSVKRATRIKVTTHDFDIITVTAAGTNFVFDNIEILASAQGAGAYWAIACAGGGLRVRNATFNAVESGIHVSGTATKTNIGPSVYMVSLRTSNGIGIQYSTTGESHSILDCRLENGSGARAAAGIKIIEGGGYNLTHCDIFQWNRALYVVPAAAASVGGLGAVNCFFDNCDNDNIFLDGSAAGATIQRFRFTNCWINSSSDNCVRLKGNVLSAKFVNCEINDATNGGFNVMATSVNVDGLIIDASTFSGNGTAISIPNGATDYIVTNNYIGNTASFGANTTGLVFGGTSSDNYVVTGNVAIGNGTNFTDNGVNPATRTRQVKNNVGDTTRSGYETIADDAVFSFTPPFTSGFIKVLREDKTEHSGIVLFDSDGGGGGGAPTTVKIGGGASFDVSTGVLTGTDGADTNVTVSVDASNVVYIENRSGGSWTFSYEVTMGVE